MPSRTDDRVEDLRALAVHDDEGSLWIMLFEDPHGVPVLVTIIDDAMAHLEDATLRNLARVLGELPARAALLLIPRCDGQPWLVDRWLWTDLEHRVHGSIELLDLVVVGTTCYWSARAETL